MGVRKDDPFGSQLVQAWRLRLRIAFQHPRPVVQIIDGDEHDVWLAVLAGGVFSFTDLAHYAQQEQMGSTSAPRAISGSERSLPLRWKSSTK